jgi:hypothetical protein
LYEVSEVIYLEWESEFEVTKAIKHTLSVFKGIEGDYFYPLKIFNSPFNMPDLDRKILRYPQIPSHSIVFLSRLKSFHNSIAFLKRVYEKIG